MPQGLIAVYRALGGGWELREDQDFVPVEVKEEMEERTDWGGLLSSDKKEIVIRTPDW